MRVVSIEKILTTIISSKLYHQVKTQCSLCLLIRFFHLARYHSLLLLFENWEAKPLAKRWTSGHKETSQVSLDRGTNISNPIP